MAAGLLLVAAALGDRFADGLLIADRGWLRFDVDAEAIAQPLERDPQMRLALPPQYDVVGPRIVDHGERRIFLVQPQQRLPEFDVVLAVAGRQRYRQHRRRRLDLDQRRRRGLAAGQRVAGLDGVELAERDGFAGLGSGALAVVRAVDGRMPDILPGLARRGLQHRT